MIDLRTVSILVFSAAMISACTRTEITQTSKNQAVISTSAAPVCGTEGALRVANQMAAVATLRQGFERFLLAGIGTDSNVQVTQVPGTTTYTTGTVNTYGNTAYGNFQTYTPSTTIVTGGNRARMNVLMLNSEDTGYENALDAKQVLGPDWQKKVSDGISTCQ